MDGDAVRSTGEEDWAARRRAIATGRYWSSPNGPRSRWRHGLFSRLLGVFGGALRLTPFHARGLRNALDLRLTELELRLPGLPQAFDGYRVLHVSDTHLDTLPAVADAAVPLLKGLEVDLLALTGDVHGMARHALDLSVEPLARVVDGVRVRDRRLAVLGNHDPVEMVEALERLGFETLVNRSVMLQRGAQSVHITGLDDVHHFYQPAARRALDEPQDGFRIALVHSAEMADHAAAAGVGLYLCGHTHGGQICLPGGRPIFTQLTRCRYAASGVWRHGAMIGYTSPGLGVSPPTLRFNTRGGAALITLRTEGSGTAGVRN
jgi:predicted MPP superfamily phosphohydrolase